MEYFEVRGVGCKLFVVLVVLASAVDLAVEVGGGPGWMDSNDWSAAGNEMPLWAALAVLLSCRLFTVVSIGLASCSQSVVAMMLAVGGFCPTAGVGDPGGDPGKVRGGSSKWPRPFVGLKYVRFVSWAVPAFVRVSPLRVLTGPRVPVLSVMVSFRCRSGGRAVP